MSLPTRQRPSNWRLLLPGTLVVAGVTLLLGCIYVPGTYQYQPSGARRPESIIGKTDSSAPVKIGATRIDDALPILERAVTLRLGTTLDQNSNIVVSDTDRRIGVHFSVVTGQIIGICGSSTDYANRMLVLEFDADGIITGCHTLGPADHGFLGFHRWKSGDSVRLFGPERAAKLEQNGALLTDEQRERQSAAREYNWTRKPTPIDVGPPTTAP